MSYIPAIERSPQSPIDIENGEGPSLSDLVIGYIKSYIKENSLLDVTASIPPDILQTQQNTVIYYNIFRTLMRFKANSKKKEKCLEIVSYIFPDQFVLLKTTEIATNRIVMPIIKRIISFENLATYIHRTNIFFAAKRIYRIFSKHAQCQPVNVPIVYHAHKFAIAASQHITVISLDIMVILGIIMKWENPELNLREKKIEAAKRKNIIAQAVEMQFINGVDKLVKEEKKMRPILVASALQCAIQTCFYFAIYFCLGISISTACASLTRGSARVIDPGRSEEEIENLVQRVMSILWYGAWVPFIMFNVYYLRPTFSDVSEGFRGNFNSRNTILKDITFCPKKVHKRVTFA